MVAWLKHYWRRWQRRKSWWVAEYYIERLPNLPDACHYEEGSFAEFGDTRLEAKENAMRHIHECAWVSGVVTLTVRRPNLFEILFGG